MCGHPQRPPLVQGTGALHTEYTGSHTQQQRVLSAPHSDGAKVQLSSQGWRRRERAACAIKRGDPETGARYEVCWRFGGREFRAELQIQSQYAEYGPYLAPW